MNKIYCSAAVLLFSVMTAFTAENNNDKMKNGSFEIISKTPKGSSQYLLKRIRAGWDFGRNPVISMPKHWTPGGVTGRIQLRVIDKNKPGEEKNVQHGNKSLRLEGDGNFYCSNQFYPGTYRLSVWAKGNGRITVICHSGYRAAVRGEKPRPGKRKVLLRIKATPEWKEYQITMPMGHTVPPCDYNDILIAIDKAAPVYLDNITLIPIEKAEDKQ